VRYSPSKGNCTCYVFVNVKFNEVSKFCGTVKIRGLALFQNVTHKGVDTVLVTVDH